MATFPVITRKGSKAGFTETASRNAVSKADKDSGLPVVNKLFTFDPLSWSYSLKLVVTADKDTVDTFYGANKDVPFDWLNPQDGNTYEVIFDAPIRWTVAGSDGTIDYWNAALKLVQYSPL